MLVQSRHGEPITEDGETIYDDDYREVGEAMCLLWGKHRVDAKMLLRMGKVLELPEVAEINRELGFGKSARNPATGRYLKVVEKWLRHREQNPRILEGLVKAGFKTTVKALAKKVGYKPEDPKFFELLGWRQKQSNDGHRNIAIGEDFAAPAPWGDLDERAICERIMQEKPNYKRLVGLLPTDIGLTRAVMSAAVEAGCLSKSDLIILTPTLEELGLLQDADVKKRWETAMKEAENMRAANIAKRVRSKETAEALTGAAETALKVAVEEVMRGIRVYVIIDKSGSMAPALQKAKVFLKKLLPGFPEDKVHVSIFNSHGHEVVFKSRTGAGVEQAFRGQSANGGTFYGSGVLALEHHKSKEDEDVLFLFIGDEADGSGIKLSTIIRQAGFQPSAFGLLFVQGSHPRGRIVRDAAVDLNIPCFEFDEDMFDDPYAGPRVLRNLIDSTPIQQRATPARVAPRKTLVQKILETPLLQKPVWA